MSSQVHVDASVISFVSGNGRLAATDSTTDTLGGWADTKGCQFITSGPSTGEWKKRLIDRIKEWQKGGRFIRRSLTPTAKVSGQGLSLKCG